MHGCRLPVSSRNGCSLSTNCGRHMSARASVMSGTRMLLSLTRTAGAGAVTCKRDQTVELAQTAHTAQPLGVRLIEPGRRSDHAKSSRKNHALFQHDLQHVTQDSYRHRLRNTEKQPLIIQPTLVTSWSKRIWSRSSCIWPSCSTRLRMNCVQYRRQSCSRKIDDVSNETEKDG
jgi:hypothetical protein